MKPSRRSDPFCVGCPFTVPAMADDGRLHSRVRSLSAREARVFLLSDERLTMQDIGDALDVSPAVVANARQTIRRKLAVPKGIPLNAFLDEPGVRDLARDVAEAKASPERERRQRHLLRSAIHELDVALRRVVAKEKTLRSLASHADGKHRADLISEAAEVSAIAQRLEVLRDETVAAARNRAMTR